MKDPLFGNLDWQDGYWEGSVTLPYFRGFGAAMPGVTQDPTDYDIDEDPGDTPEVSTGKIDLLVAAAGGSRAKPTDAQRLAWTKIRDRKNEVWDELMARTLDEYRRQRPTRVRWWETVFGEHALDRLIPALYDPAALAKLIHPVTVVVQPHAVAPAATPDVLVQFAGSWLPTGFAVILRDGRVAGFSRYETPDTAKIAVRFDHPVFGRVGWNIHYDAWIAHAPWNAADRADGLESFAPVAPMRAKVQSNPGLFRNPELPLEWDFINGNFATVIHPSDVEPPTARQAAACESFRANAKQHAAAIAAAIFDAYQSSEQSSRVKVKDAAALREYLELSTIHVFPDDPKDSRPIPIGITFYGPADTGFGVVFRDGKVESVGDTNTAESPRRPRSGKRPVAPKAEPAADEPPQVKAPQAKAPPAPAAKPAKKPAGKSAGRSAAKPARGRVVYTLKLARDGDSVGTDYDVKSDHLDRVLHPRRKLRVIVHEDSPPPRRGDRAGGLGAFGDTTLVHYLRNQDAIRAQLEEALASDQEERWPEGEGVRGDVWSWARLVCLKFDPPTPRRKNPPKAAFTLTFDCDWEEEHQVLVHFEDDRVKGVSIE